MGTPVPACWLFRLVWQHVGGTCGSWAAFIEPRWSLSVAAGSCAALCLAARRGTSWGCSRLSCAAAAATALSLLAGLCSVMGAPRTGACCGAAVALLWQSLPAWCAGHLRACSGHPPPPPSFGCFRAMVEKGCAGLAGTPAALPATHPAPPCMPSPRCLCPAPWHSMLAQGKCGWPSKLTAACGLAAAAAARTHALPAGPRGGSGERGGACGASVPATGAVPPSASPPLAAGPPPPCHPPTPNAIRSRGCFARASGAAHPAAGSWHHST